jgi:putative transposase
MPTKFKHCKRYNDPGHAHELTFTCFKNQPFLAKDRARSWLAEAIALARRKHSFHVWSYVFMPEHVHLLIWPTR